MSNTKKFLSLFCLILALALIVGCTPKASFSRSKSEAEAILNTVEGRLDFTTADLTRTGDITFTTSYGSYEKLTFTWTSSNTEVITNDGKVTNPIIEAGQTAETAAVQVEVSCKIAVEYAGTADGNGVAEKTKTWTFTILGVEGIKTISEVKTMAKDTVVTLEGVVVAKILKDQDNHENAVGMYVNDGTDGIYVYGSNSANATAVGSKVKVVGTIDEYYSIKQIASPTVTVLEETATPVVNGDTTIAQIDASKFTTGTTVNGSYGGRYYNVYTKITKVVDGSKVNYYAEDPYTGERLEIYYKSAYDYVTNKGETWAATLETWNDKYVTLPVCTYDVYSSTQMARVVLAKGTIVEAEAPVVTDAMKISQVKATLGTLETTYYTDSTAPVALPTTHESGATISWASSHEDVLSAAGVINPEAATTEVTLTATITAGSETDTYELVVNVIKKSYIPVATAKAKELKSNVVVRGLVSAIYARGFVLTDNTGSVLVYIKSGFKNDVALGDYIETAGTLDAYPTGSKCFQIVPDNYQKVTDETPSITLPEVTTWTATEIDEAWEEVVAGTYDLVGPVVTINKVTITVSGSYYNGSVEGSTSSLSFSFPTTAIAEALKAVDGFTATLKVAPLSYSNFNNVPKYFNFIVLEVIADEISAADKLAADKESHKLPTELTENTKWDVELKKGTTVAYTSANTDVLSVDATGAVTVVRPEVGAEDASVVVTVVYTNGEATETISHTVVVKAKPAPVTGVPEAITVSYLDLVEEKSYLTDGNVTALMGFADTVLSVNFTKVNTSGSHILSSNDANNPNGHIRFYKSDKLTFTCTDERFVIDTIKVTTTKTEYNTSVLTVNGTAGADLTHTYTVNSKTAEVANTAQARITEIVITFKAAQ